MIKEGSTLRTNKHQLAALYQTMLANNDEENALKILDLHNKLMNKELIVSFSGHFSAGKSSIINHLLGENILPKSPIPTSANIVKITSGEGWARVYFNKGKAVEYKEPYDINMIKEYSTDKDSIHKIEISTSKAIIPEGSAVIDTPGIDAADDADRLMTEGSLHLVDVLFYVMDYNHVQSEVNLYFLQSLKENQIPFYLIINQIDKHNDAELKFDQFVTNIKQTFDQWQIHPLGMYFTSLHDFSIANNQFSDVKSRLFSMMQSEKSEFFNIDASVNQVVMKHKKFLQDQYGELLSDFEDDDSASKLSEIQDIEQKITDLKEQPQKLEKEFQQELSSTLNNAYLMPKELRDKAESYLAAEQSGFKVGLFGSKKKTDEERQSRRDIFLNGLKEIMESSIQWKLRDKFLNIYRNYNLEDLKLQEMINNITISYELEDLEALMKPGAQINGDYVLNYTNDVAADVKSKFKRIALNILTQLKHALENKNAKVLLDYQTSYDNLQDAQQLQAKYKKIEEELKMKEDTVDQMFVSPIFNENKWEDTLNQYNKTQSDFVIEDSPQKGSTKNKKDEVLETPVIEEETSTKYEAVEIINRIDQTLSTIETIPGFNDLMKDLELKKHRLANRTYTIALFGAFSAGKSSFSNALIGERVLPVSPNPTTATVNRIHPVSESHPHGTVVVTMKREEALVKELYAMTNKFSPKADTLEEFVKWIRKKKIQQHKNLSNMYQAYILAVITGYDENKALIGKETTISLEEFATYVTDETIACYIETIDLYYDSALTKQGITLVDTPGADSVNARHTNVAFNYIKHADAILYVTYYNHALSRADRDFLMQLGRVKEAFELDKMFFIVNAADLAENEEELALVLDYVDNELMKLGIRHAKLFPVSSKQSIEEKLDNKTLNEQMKAFEDKFYSFIHHDLTRLIIDSSLWDINRVAHTLKSYIESVSLNEDDKAKKIEKTTSDEHTVIDIIETYDTSVYQQQIEQRIEKQLYYVIERLGIRFHDMFKEMFNPTTITENGRKANDQLKNALDNLIEYVRFELNQELQAVSLRVEGYKKELIGEVYQSFLTKSSEINDIFDLPKEYTVEFETPTFKEEFVELPSKEFNTTLNKFKGTKAFFVQNEKELMKEELYSALLPSVETFVKENSDIMRTSYLKQWSEQVDVLKISTEEKIKQYTQNYFAMLEAPADIDSLKENLELINKLVK
ncbi:dynamin family protein [Oceanobacillus sp. CAU 1775]